MSLPFIFIIIPCNIGLKNPTFLDEFLSRYYSCKSLYLRFKPGRGASRTCWFFILFMDDINGENIEGWFSRWVIISIIFKCQISIYRFIPLFDDITMPDRLDVEQCDFFMHKSMLYQLNKNVIFKILLDGNICNFLEKSKVSKLLATLHTEDACRHYAPKNIMAKFVNVDYNI